MSGTTITRSSDQKTAFFIVKIKDTPTVIFDTVGTRKKRKILVFIKIRSLAAEKSTVKDH